jgi:hypothetical protein
MTTPQTINKEKEKKEDKILFSRKVVLEVYEKELYSSLLEDYIKSREVKIDGKTHYVNGDWGKFEEIMESLKKKIDVLRYINDSTYEQIKLEILLDIGRLLYKLEYKHRV